MMTYRNAPNYTRSMCRPDGSVIQTFVHCGKCMSIIVGVACEHCARIQQKKRASLEALLAKKRLTPL